MPVTTSSAAPTAADFWTVLCEQMTTAHTQSGLFAYRGSPEPCRDLTISPAAHVLHYGSAVFEGMKAHRQSDGSLAVFRLDDHVARLVRSAEGLCLPPVDPAMLRRMIIDAVAANATETPDPPGSLYIRPTLIGTEANIGAATSPSQEALLYVVCSPVGDYFKGGPRPLTLLLETSLQRTVAQFGMIKCGANYAMAMGLTQAVMAANEAVDQILFATADDITETGASNFFLVDDNRVVTRHLDESFLHGVTRDCVIRIADHLGYQVEERSICPDELIEWCERGEAFLSGTAAVVAPVGTIIHGGESLHFSGGQLGRNTQPGRNTMRLRQALMDIQTGAAPDMFAWRTPIAR